ncbi:MAG: M20/M25/M40 family metallo-hydrolase, partial [Calditrichaeota bacterium]
MNLYQLTEKLISIPSVTEQEAQLAEFVSDFLQARGFHVQLQQVTAARQNLLATAGAVPKVILCTHLDTVPPFIPFSQDERFLYGRGACDAKGAMAAMLQAALRLRDEGQRDFGLLFVVGEEGDSIGAKRANELNPGS